MAISSLDPKPALIVVDLQKGLAAAPTIHPLTDVAKRAGKLAEAFRRNNLPVVLVNVSGQAPGRVEQGRPHTARPPEFTDILAELNQQPQDKVVTKNAWGAFTHTDLDQYLKSCGVTQVLLAGVATSIGVESTARAAHELGYNVALISDAITDLDVGNHTHSMTKIFPKLGEIGTTEEASALVHKTYS